MDLMTKATVNLKGVHIIPHLLLFSAINNAAYLWVGFLIRPTFFSCVKCNFLLQQWKYVLWSYTKCNKQNENRTHRNPHNSSMKFGLKCKMLLGAYAGHPLLERYFNKMY